MLGYGLTDVKTRDGRIADGRINRKSILLWNSGDRDAAPEGYMEWIKQRRPLIYTYWG